MMWTNLKTLVVGVCVCEGGVSGIKIPFIMCAVNFSSFIDITIHLMELLHIGMTLCAFTTIAATTYFINSNDEYTPASFISLHEKIFLLCLALS